MTQDEFVSLASSLLAREGAGERTVLVPLGVRLLGDQLTPVLAYRRLVVGDERTAPSFLLESVEGGERIGRYSLMGARPLLEVVARQESLSVRHRGTGEVRSETHADPLDALRRIAATHELADPGESARRSLPGSPWGGWFGYAGYDTMRYAEPGKLGFERAPRDDRALPDLSFGLYDEIVVFDHVETLVHVVRLVEIGAGVEPREAFERALAGLESTATALQTHSKPLPSGAFAGAPGPIDWSKATSTHDRASHKQMVERVREYIRAGDVFQVVVGQRFERPSSADPFDVYRALRALNPSPYMGYLQGEGCILVASSPEILCRVDPGDRPGRMVVTNRPLAGTRKRGSTDDEDSALERDLLADEKERSEHIMLVDLGRNDVGRVAEVGSVELPAVMEIERYSHVMHISSTVTGELREGVDQWDALRAALPVGTISGAPKIRAMQIIDELEPVRRGPYGGGFGYVGMRGEMDVALALRTIVVPVDRREGDTWVYHLQAAGGIVAESDPGDEFQETVNKASALARAIDVAEEAFSTEG